MKQKKYCGCHKAIASKQAVQDIRDEWLELKEEPSMDELSDVLYGVGRLLGSLIRMPYIRIPGDGLHIKKINERMLQYGCIRSKRHLINGHCPSENNNQ
jgi:hypothetical protein